MALLSALGLDYKLLIAYALNFIVLVFILNKIGYKPMLKFVQERTKKIEDGVKNAELAKTNLEQASHQREEMITAAHKEAQGIIDQAKHQAELQASQVMEKSRQDSEKVVQASQQVIAQERSAALNQAKQEVANLVLAATEKVLRQKVDATVDKTFVDSLLSS